MADQIFRETSLERLSSPERLDSLMTVTTPRGWLALVAICLVLGGALIWGFKGRMRETIDGAGIILRRGGLAAVQATGSGMITAVPVKIGDLLQPGAVVARLAQPELERNIAQIEGRLRDLQAHGVEAGGLIKGSRELEIASIKEQLRQMEPTEKSLREQLTYLQERLTAQDEAVRRGLINRDIPQGTRQEIARMQDTIAGMAAQRTQLAARVEGSRNQASQSLFSLDNQIRVERHQLELLGLQYERASVVRSLYGGRVIEILADVGSTLRDGQALLSIDAPDEPLDCYVFVPLSGKQIQPGMPVRVVPAGLAWEVYGYMVGKVQSVSRTPMSPAAMDVYLHNATLVQQFNAAGAAYLVQVELEADPATRSGFKWTSQAGPLLDINGGTLLRGTITIREQAPITLVIPALRRWLGI